jgi:hypothetical protein
MMGLPFASSFKDFAESIGVDSSRVAAIKKNPEQSKHLEPATLRVLGLDIDFVNLRSEQYASDSRIPAEIVRSSYLVLSFFDLFRASALHSRTHYGATLL